MKSKAWIFLVGAALLLALTGCATPVRKAAVAQAAETFAESALAGDVNVTLAIAPIQIGSNRFKVTVDDPSVTAVEAQVIMASMGHGSVVDLTPAGPGRFEVDTNIIDMTGKWMIRTKLTTDSGETKAATFHLEIGTSCLPANSPSGL